jgi:hypothetical protein
LSEKKGREGNFWAFATLDGNWKEDTLAKLPVPEESLD